MRAIPAIVIKDLRRRLRNPLSTILMIAFPVFFSLLIGATFGEGEGEGLPPIEILLVDEDGSLTGGLLRSALGHEEMGVRFTLREVERAEGESLISQGKASALLLIPEGFTENVLESRPDTLFLWRNPAESIMPVVAQEFTEVVALVLDSAARLFGEPLSAINSLTRDEGLPADEDVASISVAINQTFHDLQRYIDPLLVEINTVEPEPEEGDTLRSGPMLVTLWVLPGMAVFSLLLVGQMTMRDILREKATGTLRRTVAAPVTVPTVVLSKVVSSLMVGLACLVALSLVAVAFHAPLVDPVAYLVLSLVFLLAASGFAAISYGAARSEQQGMSVGHIIIMIMAFMGGSWFPLEMMPESMRRLAPYTLNYWANEGYKELLFEGAGLPDLGTNVLVLGVVGVLTISLGGITLRYRLMRGM